MSADAKPLRRVAFVWTGTAIEEVEIVGEWPAGIVRGSYVHTHEVNADGTPFVKRGRKSGTEFLHYSSRRVAGCDEAAMAAETLGLKGEYRDGDVDEPEPDRSPGEAECTEPRAAAQPKRRGFFKRAGEHAPVQDR